MAMKEMGRIKEIKIIAESLQEREYARMDTYQNTDSDLESSLLYKSTVWQQV